MFIYFNCVSAVHVYKSRRALLAFSKKRVIIIKKKKKNVKKIFFVYVLFM